MHAASSTPYKDACKPWKRRNSLSQETRSKTATRIAKARGARGDREQLRLLDSRLGPGVGATRERKRLADRLKKYPVRAG
jgi:hypothetical protein